MNFRLPSKGDIISNLNEKGYILIQNFLSAEQCELIRKEAEGNISEWFTKENLLSHAAYISDDNKGRRSWAFALKTSLRRK